MNSSLFKFLTILACLGMHPLLAQLDVGLIVHYPLNGNANDASANGFNGTPFDVAWGPNSQMVANSALISNGNSTYINLPDEPELKPQFPITVSVQANFFEINGQQVIFTNDFATATHSGIWFQLATSGAFVASYGNAAGGYTAATRHGKAANYTIESNTWYVITAIFRGMNDIDIYINCELVSGNYSGNANALGYTEAPGSLCRKYANPITSGLPPEHFEGSIHDFRMWDRELTEEEILGLCTTECPGEITGISETFCSGSPGSIQADFSQIDEGVTFTEWTIESLGIFEGESLNVTPNASGVYTYTLTASTASGCNYEYAGEITVLNTGEAPELPTNIGFCEGNSATLDLETYINAFNVDVGGQTVNTPTYTFPGAGIYTFNFGSTCGNYSIDVEVEEGAASILMEIPEEICAGAEVQVGLPDWPSISAEADLTIDFGNGTVTDVNSASMLTSYPNSGSYTVIVSGSIGDCEASASQEINVEEGLPEFSLTPLSTICPGERFEIDFSDLDFDLVNSQGNPIQSFSTSLAGTYTFTASNACGSVERQLEVNVIAFNPLPLALKQQICPNRDTVSVGFSNQNLAVLWSTGATTPTIQTSVEGLYFAQISDNSGTCSREYSFEVENFVFNPRNVWPDETISLCEEGERTVHPAFIGVPYTFSDGSVGFNFYVEESGVIEVEYTDQCYTYQEAVTVELGTCLCPLWVPNAFTPNADGLNDLFMPVADCPVYDFHLQVFDRWGRMVFESRDIDDGWNGASPNTDYYAQNSIFAYLIRYNQRLDGVDVPGELKGHISLLR